MGLPLGDRSQHNQKGADFAMYRTHSKNRNRRRVPTTNVPIFEPLPSRLMMSATLPTQGGVVHPSFVLGHHEAAPITADTNGIRPLATTPPGFTAAQIRKAYGLNNIRFGAVGGDGNGQTIAIVDAFHDPRALADLQTFD